MHSLGKSLRRTGNFKVWDRESLCDKTLARLYDTFAARSRLAKRRLASELPAQGAPLLLDAAFLVPRARAASFRSLAARTARDLARQGYALTLTGPWPPYTFVQD